MELSAWILKVEICKTKRILEQTFLKTSNQFVKYFHASPKAKPRTHHSHNDSNKSTRKTLLSSPRSPIGFAFHVIFRSTPHIFQFPFRKSRGTKASASGKLKDERWLDYHFGRRNSRERFNLKLETWLESQSSTFASQPASAFSARTELLSRATAFGGCSFIESIQLIPCPSTGVISFCHYVGYCALSGHAMCHNFSASRRDINLWLRGGGESSSSKRERQASSVNSSSSF